MLVRSSTYRDKECSHVVRSCSVRTAELVLSRPRLIGTLYTKADRPPTVHPFKLAFKTCRLARLSSRN